MNSGTAAPCGHVVQLYGQDEQLLQRSVGRYLGEGLARGDSLLVIATAEHREAFICRLAANGHEPMEAMHAGRLLLLDAGEVLSRFMIEGRPHQDRFEEAIGGEVRKLAERAGHPRLTAYGEMVGLLWLEGQREAAIELEELWNRFLEKSTVSLFCAYPIDVFGSEFHDEALDPLLSAHTHMVSAGEDLQGALERAITDVLGKPITGSPPGSPREGAWNAMPQAEETVLRLRRDFPERADEILDRARHYRASWLKTG